MQKLYTTNSAQETAGLAKEIAKSLKGGEVLALSGDLGAGKTAFVQGLALALGVKDKVQSPTFNLLKVYNVSKKYWPTRLAESRLTGEGGLKFLVHVDAYRLNDGSETTEIGLSEYLNSPDAVVAIEWPENIASVISDSAIKISFSLGKTVNSREIKIIFS